MGGFHGYRAKLNEAARNLACENSEIAVVAACETAADRIVAGIDAELTPDERLEALADAYRVDLNVVHTTEELDDFVATHAARGDLGFLTRRKRFDDDLLAAVLRRRDPAPGDRVFVALVDARGQKGSMAFFSETHEVAHPVLEPQLAFDFREESRKRDDWEALVDRVGSAMVFRGAPWCDAVSRLVPSSTGVALSSLEALKDNLAPRASMTATWIAIANTAQRAFLVVHAMLASSANDPSPVLRIDQVTPSTLGEAGATFIHRKRRVPASSPLAIAMRSRKEAYGFEDLATWKDGRGVGLKSRRVWTAAIPTGAGGVFGVIDFGHAGSW